MPMIAQPKHTVRNSSIATAVVVFAVAAGMVFIFRSPIDDWLYRIGLRHQNVSTVLAKANQDQLETHYSQAIAALQQGLRRTSNKNDELSLDSALAAYYAGAGDNANALKYYLDVRKLAPGDYSNSQPIANVLHNLGRDSEAVPYYKQAIAQVDAQTTNPFGPAEKAELETQLAAAEANK